MPHLFVAVEGMIDAAIARRLAQLVGFSDCTVYESGGKLRLDERLSSYNAAAKHGAWLVIRDLDQDAECAARLVQEKLPRLNPTMCLRVAVRAVEAWVLADGDEFARTFGVKVGALPSRPDEILDPKLAVVNLARRSRHKRVREDLVPESGLSARVGPLYNARMVEFVQMRWRPERAASRSESLGRCLRALRRLSRDARG
jgi:hypothetical protein